MGFKYGGYGRIPQDALLKMIEQHELWIKSGKRFGEQADFSQYCIEDEIHLAGRDLSGAIFRGTDFSHTNLNGTILRGADLRGAYFEETTQLNNTDFIGALMDTTTIFDGADISKIHHSAVDFGNTNLLKTQEEKLPPSLRPLQLIQMEHKDPEGWRTRIEGRKTGAKIGG